MEWLILYIALYYLGSPIIVKYKHFHKRFSEPQRLNPQSFPKEIFDYFYKIGNDLTALGFSPRVYFRNTGQVPNVVSYYTLWVNEKTKDYAIAALMNVNRSIIKRQIPLISIISEYIDGTKVYTHNSSQPAIFKRRPNRKVRHIPKCGDVTLLFQIHNKFIDELGINLAKTPPARFSAPQRKPPHRKARRSTLKPSGAAPSLRARRQATRTYGGDQGVQMNSS